MTASTSKEPASNGTSSNGTTSNETVAGETAAGGMAAGETAAKAARPPANPGKAARPPANPGKAAELLQRITAAPLGPYQSAVIRIGFSATWLLFLLWELPNRHEMYGPDGPWSWSIGREFTEGNDAFTALLWSNSTVWFEIVYFGAMLSALLLCLGWRTRTMSAVFMVGVLSLQNRSIFVGDGGDNVIHIMAIYLLVTRCARVWSLDARREARTEPDAPDRVGPVLWVVTGTALLFATLLNRTGVPVLVALWVMWLVLALWWLVNHYGPRSQGRILLDAVANLAHNAGLVVIMAEVCLIYATAGWYKVQGSRWQDGTALYYPLKLDYFTPFPALSDLLASHGVMVMVLTYGTVIVQVAFPFTLFNRRVKNVLLAVMMLEHAAIAVVLGLPFFSLAMIAADAVFLPTAFLLWLGVRAGRGRDRVRALFPSRSAATAPAGAAAAGQAGPGTVPEQRRDGSEQPRTLVG
ncbi:HTTM domain-containing protein [Streptomyces sp. NPDC020412]|uniref:HTTM domain-containing protein n=1 Tax=Streptomyces sp. NPDC020412 TaxID=3365073 RepID=UPI0037957F22